MQRERRSKLEVQRSRVQGEKRLGFEIQNPMSKVGITTFH